jgi:hypothetical protein
MVLNNYAVWAPADPLDLSESRHTPEYRCSGSGRRARVAAPPHARPRSWRTSWPSGTTQSRISLPECIPLSAVTATEAWGLGLGGLGLGAWGLGLGAWGLGLGLEAWAWVLRVGLERLRLGAWACGPALARRPMAFRTSRLGHQGLLQSSRFAVFSASPNVTGPHSRVTDARANFLSY